MALDLMIGKINIVHSTPVWLPQTMAWLYHQVLALSEDVVSHIVCEDTVNTDQFDLPHIHSLKQMPYLYRQWNLKLRRLGVRRHLVFLVELAKKHRADIIHSHLGNIGWADIGAAKQLGARHVVTFYGYDINVLPSIEPV